MNGETWKPIPGYEDAYEVSDRGRVRSVDRTLSDGRSFKGRLLKQKTTSHGYREVNLSLANYQRTWSVHTLVLLAFVGPRPDSHEACHWNDRPADNRLENLRWGTSSENSYDYVRNGRHHNAAKNTCKRGHKLADANLLLRSDRAIRQCRSCDYARQKVRRNASLDFQKVSDNYYRQFSLEGK